MRKKRNSIAQKSGVRRRFLGRPAAPPVSSLQPPASIKGFTLTELLIVIAIIAVLAALITAAAVNALKAANRGRINLAIQGVSRAVEDFKNDYGAYPPNAMNPQTSGYATVAAADFQRMFKKAFPRHQEPPALIAALTGNNTGGSSTENLEYGLTAAEAVYFWLGGFSEDPQFPISGPGGPSFVDNGNPGDEVLENRNQRYEFDLSLLGPRNDNGVFDTSTGKGRYLTYQQGGVNRRINLWQYTPKGSAQPLVYFDVSRHKPGVPASIPNTYDAWAAEPGVNGLPLIFALKQRREGVSAVNNFTDLVFVNQGKFQVLHAGLDDAWGENFASMGAANSSADNIPTYPEGPFLGEIADTLTNFTDGELGDSAE